MLAHRLSTGVEEVDTVMCADCALVMMRSRLYVPASFISCSAALQMLESVVEAMPRTPRCAPRCSAWRNIACLCQAVVRAPRRGRPRGT